LVESSGTWSLDEPRPPEAPPPKKPRPKRFGTWALHEPRPPEAPPSEPTAPTKAYDYPEGAYLVEWRRPSGEIVTVQTQDLGRTVRGVESRQAGVVFSVSGVTPGGQRGRVIYDRRAQALKDIRTRRREELLAYARTRQVPSWYREQVEVPSHVSDIGLQKEYTRAGYESQYYETARYPFTRPEHKFKKIYKEKYWAPEQHEQRLKEFMESEQWKTYIKSPSGQEQLKITREAIAYEGLGPLDIVTIVGVPTEKAERRLAGQMLFSKDPQRVIWESYPFQVRGRRLVQEGIVSGGLFIPRLVETGLHLGFKTPTPVGKFEQEHFVSYTPSLFEAPFTEGARLTEGKERVSESILKTGAQIIGLKAGTGTISLGVGKIKAGYVEVYPHLPKAMKQLRHSIKTGTSNLRFRFARFTGRGMYRPGQLVSHYAPGTWKEIPYNVITRASYPFRPSKVLITGRGKVIPLETYTPVRPGPGGRIVDVGKMPGARPRLAVGGPKRWWFTDSRAVKIGFDPGIKVRPFVGKPTITQPVGVVSKAGPQFLSYKTVTTGGFKFPSPTVKAPIVSGISRVGGGFAGAYGAVSLRALEFLEEGLTGVHPRWEREFKLGRISALSLQPISMPKLDLAYRPDVKTGVMSESMWEQRFKQIPIVTPIVSPKVSQAQAQAQMQIQLQMPIFKQELVMQPETSLMFKPGVRYRGKGRFKIPLLPLLDGAGDRSIREEPGKGFKVEVKDRYIVRGKKKYKEQFSTLRTHPLSKQDAMSLGATVVDNSASASFRIRPVSGRSRPLKLSVNSWSSIGHKFYSSKRKCVVIENILFRIDSFGEVAQSPGRAVFSQMKRQARVKPTKGKPVDRAYGPEVFDMKQFRKAMRLL